MNANSPAKLKEQNRINTMREQERELENIEREAALKQAMETCNFWREEYKKQSSSYNKMQRDQSCSFARQFR